MIPKYVDTPNQLRDVLANPKYRHLSINIFDNDRHRVHDVDFVNVYGHTRLMVSDVDNIHGYNYSDIVVREGQRNVYADMIHHSVIKANGAGTVVLRDMAEAFLEGDFEVEADGNSRVTCKGDNVVFARANSNVHVSKGGTCYGSVNSTVVCDNSSVVARHNGVVHMKYNGRAVVTDQVVVYGHHFDEIHAYGESTIYVYGPGTVFADKNVTVYVYNPHAEVTGGIQVDMTSVSKETDPVRWVERNNVEIRDGKAILYKGTDQDGVSGREYCDDTSWEVGKTVVPRRWIPDRECGNGLHLCANIADTLSYVVDGRPRFFKVEVDIRDIVVLSNDKVKVPQCRVLEEVWP